MWNIKQIEKEGELIGNIFFKDFDHLLHGEDHIWLRYF